jgi:hypothetical protein
MGNRLGKPLFSNACHGLNAAVLDKLQTKGFVSVAIMARH